MKKILKVIFIILGVVVLAIAGIATYVKTGLPNAEPAGDLKIDYTAERIAHGKYLATSVMACVECHSTRDFTKFTAPVVKGTYGVGGELFGKVHGFPGEYYAPNLTPANLKGWTDGELFRAITTGISKDGHALFPIMPYLSYGQLDKEDIYDVIAYIRTLEPIDSSVPPSTSAFPMSFIINTIPKAATFSAKPDTTDLLAYGKYLFTSASCQECHTKKVNGEAVEGMELAGGFDFPFPDGTIVRSMNITPDNDTGIGTWTEAQFIRKFKSFSDSSYVAPDVAPGGFKTMMPWTAYAKMKESDLKAIYAYLRTVPPVTNKVERFTASVNQHTMAE
jgi:mono/diheme cytochrome c family protein